ncbi:hypothetical protein [Butyrivibrio sp. FCS014]|uniref:hypothetical protein n=1 Tax=Butyrivibrio sp. FCS014 TaxID=1408304 RepID=UPI000466F0C9|nr:hypothetical protein [Butyrivibrio sp. FCS014]
MDNLMFDEMGMMVVSENHCCEHFEPNDDALVPMRECWCCKWSDFRADKGNGLSDGYSICNYIGNAKEAVNR